MKKLFIFSILSFISVYVHGGTPNQITIAPLREALQIPSIITSRGPLRLSYHESIGEVFETILKTPDLRNEFITQISTLIPSVDNRNFQNYLRIYNNQGPRITYNNLKNNILRNIFDQERPNQNACRQLLNIFEEALYILYDEHSKWLGIKSMNTEEAVQIIRELENIAIMKSLYLPEDGREMFNKIQEKQNWLPSHVKKYLQYGASAATGAGIAYGLPKAIEYYNKNRSKNSYGSMLYPY